MHDALISSAAHPDIPAEYRIFEPFVGAWDLEVTWYADAVPVRHEAGEWSFARVLEGRGIQDVWIVPPRACRDGADGLYEYGTSIRFYVPELQAWRSTWIGPMHNVVRTLRARRLDDTVMLETDDPGQDAMRWIFSDITDDAFVWRNFIRCDGEWRLQQDFRCRRRR